METYIGGGDQSRSGSSYGNLLQLLTWSQVDIDLWGSLILYMSRLYEPSHNIGIAQTNESHKVHYK